MTALEICRGSDTARQLEQIRQPGSRLKLVNRGTLHCSAHRRDWAERWNQDNVACLKSRIVAPISEHEELIKIGLGHDLIVTNEFDLP